EDVFTVVGGGVLDVGDGAPELLGQHQGCGGRNESDVGNGEFVPAAKVAPAVGEQGVDLREYLLDLEEPLLRRVEGEVEFLGELVAEHGVEETPPQPFPKWRALPKHPAGEPGRGKQPGVHVLLHEVVEVAGEELVEVQNLLLRTVRGYEAQVRRATRL